MKKVLVLDFGGQYNLLVARRVRECGVYCEIRSWRESMENIRAFQPDALIFTGGPATVFEPNAPMVDPALFSMGIPVLGICYGQQLMIHLLGGQCRRAETREYGKVELTHNGKSPLFKDIPATAVYWMSHGVEVETLAPGFEVVASTDGCRCAAIQCAEKQLYGVQFHPEVLHTQYGKELLQNFLYGICGFTAEWTMASYLEEAVAECRAKIGSGRVLLALSGSEMVKAANVIGLPVASEVFADRGYQADGSLVPRGAPGAMIEDEDTAIARVLQMAAQGTVQADDGSTVTLQADSVCVHGDGPKALAFVQKISAALLAAGTAVAAF